MRQPPIQANNFELKPTLITMVQRHQFTGHPNEDPNEHLGRFLRMVMIPKLVYFESIFLSFFLEFYDSF